MRSALSACFRRNLGSFTIARPLKRSRWPRRPPAGVYGRGQSGVGAVESRERLGAQFYHRIRGEQIPGFRFNESCRPATTHEIDIPSTYSRLVTKDWGVFFTETFRIWDVANKGRLSGFDNLVIGTQYQLYTDPEHQFVFTVGSTAAIGGTGAPGIASSFSTLTPTIYIGKGFGDLPDSVAWLRPLTISATVAVAVPTDALHLISTWYRSVNLSFKTGAFIR